MIMQIENTQKLGQLIRQQRKHQGLTQEQLASVCGVGLRFIRELEHGKESCHFTKVLTVLQMLGLTLSIEGITE